MNTNNFLPNTASVADVTHSKRNTSVVIVTLNKASVYIWVMCYVLQSVDEYNITLLAALYQFFQVGFECVSEAVKSLKKKQ